MFDLFDCAQRGIKFNARKYVCVNVFVRFFVVVLCNVNGKRVKT